MNMQDLPKERHLKFAQKYTHQHPNLNEDLVQHKLNVPMQKKATLQRSQTFNSIQ